MMEHLGSMLLLVPRHKSPRRNRLGLNQWYLGAGLLLSMFQHLGAAASVLRSISEECR
jgi:hypothetical protein